MSKQRTHSPKYARRLARAFERGLSLHAARGHAKPGEAGARGPPKAIPDAQLQVALKVLRDTGSLTKAAKAARIAPERLRHSASHQGVILKTGRKWGLSADLKRSIEIFSLGEKRMVILSDVAEASTAGAYRNAVHRFLNTQDRRLLMPFESRSVRDVYGIEHQLETNPNTLYRLTLSGDHAAEHIYRIHL
jgi:hypothetical protein